MLPVVLQLPPLGGAAPADPCQSLGGQHGDLVLAGDPGGERDPLDLEQGGGDDLGVLRVGEERRVTHDPVGRKQHVLGMFELLRHTQTGPLQRFRQAVHDDLDLAEGIPVVRQQNHPQRSAAYLEVLTSQLVDALRGLLHGLQRRRVPDEVHQHVGGGDVRQHELLR